MSEDQERLQAGGAANPPAFRSQGSRPDAFPSATAPGPDDMPSDGAISPEETQGNKKAVEDIFGTEANARATAALISRWVAAWERRDANVPLDQWLADELRRSSDRWTDAAEIQSTCREIINSIEKSTANAASLQTHLAAGKSKASWVAASIEDGARAAGVTNVGAYAGNIESALEKVNEQMLGTVQTQAGNISQQPNLDGFIAEQHHVDTFNLDAAAKNSPLQAKVLRSQGKNSVDIGIYDRGKLCARFQSKYGSDAGATDALFRKGDLRGQQKLVAEGQAKEIEGATDVLEYGGVRSKPLSKEDAKAQQRSAQSEQKARQYDWNDVSRIEVAKSIGKQALKSAAFAACFQGARIAARRAWNSVIGKENPPASKDIREFFDSATHSAPHTGLQVVVSGAVVAAAKNGWIKVVQNTPAGRIANMVHVGMENAKVLWRLAKGELSPEQALDAMGNTTSSAVGALIGAAKAGTLGTAIGSVFGPVGTVIGGFVGAMVGGIAGSKIGQAVYEAAKVIARTAMKVATTLAEGAVDAIKGFGRVLNPLNW